MRWTRGAVSTLVVVLGAPLLALAQEPLSRVSLDEALQLALRQNPTLRAQAASFASTRAGEITAGLRPNPTA